jgi:hypothetical protein
VQIAGYILRLAVGVVGSVLQRACYQKMVEYFKRLKHTAKTESAFVGIAPFGGSDHPSYYTSLDPPNKLAMPIT